MVIVTQIAKKGEGREGREKQKKGKREKRNITVLEQGLCYCRRVNMLC